MCCIMLVLMLADVTRGCSVVTRADITGVGLIHDNMTSSHFRDTVVTPCHECHGPEQAPVTSTDLGTMNSCILSTGEERTLHRVNIVSPATIPGPGRG